jgi:hypothetical protein
MKVISRKLLERSDRAATPTHSIPDMFNGCHDTVRRTGLGAEEGVQDEPKGGFSTG